MNIRPPAIAGSFYPANPETLREAINSFLLDDEQSELKPKALIVPHAGVQYSGKIAGKAYKQLIPWADQLKKVVILGPSHRYPLRGVALPAMDAFSTPLGNVAIDQESFTTIEHMDGVTINNDAHKLEHSIEIQLPFLQSVLLNFEILPIVVGWISAAKLEKILESIPFNSETLLVVSTDLSHFHRYNVANQIDEQTVKKILRKDPTIEPEEACGAHGLDGFLVFCQKACWKPNLIDRCNSGDITGDHSRVVGYASFTVH